MRVEKGIPTDDPHRDTYGGTDLTLSSKHAGARKHRSGCAEEDDCVDEGDDEDDDSKLLTTTTVVDPPSFHRQLMHAVQVRYSK